jgi:glutathione S-transferase
LLPSQHFIYIFFFFFFSFSFFRYIEETFSHNPLLPSNPTDKYKVRLFIERNNKLVPSMYKLLKNDSIDNQNELTSVLKSLSIDLSRFGGTGPFAIGSQFTLADIAFIPFFERIIVNLKHYRNFDIPHTEEFKRLHAWADACFARDSVKATR